MPQTCLVWGILFSSGGATMDLMPTGQLISTGQVCQLLDISPTTVRRLVNAGRLFAIVLNRQLFYNRADVLRYRDERVAMGGGQKSG